MRIGVLEWASCGGAADVVRLPASIRHEGWAMCRALIDSLHRAGHDVVACLLPDLPIDELLSKSQSTDCSSLRMLDRNIPVRSQWREAYQACEITIVVAPESDGLLTELETWCGSEGIQTASCDGTFIEYTGDKWLTAQCWLPHPDCRHPPTELLCDWRADAPSCDEMKWVVKARDGAGCDGMQRMNVGELKQLQKRCAEGDRWIVQPWLTGTAYSRVAIVDSRGRFHWLPIVEQRLHIDQTVRYCGGRVLAEPFPSPFPTECLEWAMRAIPGKAQGWVGIDFLISETGEIAVIEINPRLTTSFVGLSKSFSASLAEFIVRAVMGEDIELPSDWKAVEFGLDIGTVPVTLAGPPSTLDL